MTTTPCHRPFTSLSWLSWPSQLFFSGLLLHLYLTIHDGNYNALQFIAIDAGIYVFVNSGIDLHIYCIPHVSHTVFDPKPTLLLDSLSLFNIAYFFSTICLFVASTGWRLRVYHCQASNQSIDCLLSSYIARSSVPSSCNYRQPPSVTFRCRPLPSLVEWNRLLLTAVTRQVILSVTDYCRHLLIDTARRRPPSPVEWVC